MCEIKVKIKIQFSNFFTESRRERFSLRRCWASVSFWLVHFNCFAAARLLDVNLILTMVRERSSDTRRRAFLMQKAVYWLHHHHGGGREANKQWNCENLITRTPRVHQDEQYWYNWTSPWVCTAASGRNTNNFSVGKKFSSLALNIVADDESWEISIMKSFWCSALTQHVWVVKFSRESPPHLTHLCVRPQLLTSAYRQRPNSPWLSYFCQEKNFSFAQWHPSEPPEKAIKMLWTARATEHSKNLQLKISCWTIRQTFVIIISIKNIFLRVHVESPAGERERECWHCVDRGRRRKEKSKIALISFYSHSIGFIIFYFSLSLVLLREASSSSSWFRLLVVVTLSTLSHCVDLP